MAEIYLTKRYGTLMPSSEADAEKINNLPDGEAFRCAFTRPRNMGFHRKYFALLDVLYQCFEPVPPPRPEGMPLAKWEKIMAESPPQKNRDRFRKDIAIATGHHELVVNIRGEVRAEARSISFAKMDEAEFAQLYSMTIDYGLARIAKDRSRAELENWVNQILDFA